MLFIDVEFWTNLSCLFPCVVPNSQLCSSTVKSINQTKNLLKLSKPCNNNNNNTHSYFFPRWLSFFILRLINHMIFIDYHNPLHTNLRNKYAFYLYTFFPHIYIGDVTYLMVKILRPCPKTRQFYIWYSKFHVLYIQMRCGFTPWIRISDGIEGLNVWVK